MRPIAVTGRAGRLWLQRRLDIAVRAAELLEHKQRILASELERRELLAAHTSARWTEAAEQATIWLRRAGALETIGTIRAAAPREPARVSVHLAAVMGVIYPERADYEPPQAHPGVGGAVLTPTARAHAAAIQAGVRHAAAGRAVAALRAELEATRARQLAVQNRWIPHLQAALADLMVRLDEADREENTRLRWVADAGGDRR